MDIRSSEPFAALKNGIGETFPPLGGAARCDVAVIGAGIRGALVVDELVSAGLDVVVLDKRDAGHGSSCASTALLQYEIQRAKRIMSAGNRFAAMMDHFSECVRDDKQPRTPGEEGPRDVKIMTAIYESARKAGELMEITP